jgi:hypothetical protein
MSGSNGVVSKAKALCLPGGHFEPSGRATVLKAAAEILRASGSLRPAQARAIDRLAGSDLRADDLAALAELVDQLMGAELRVVQQALRLSHIGPVREEPPAVAPELLQRIAEKAAVLEARRLAADAALDAQVLKGRALRTAKTPAKTERGLAELREAEAEYLVAREAHERAQAALMGLYAERDNWARAALLAESTK